MSEFIVDVGDADELHFAAFQKTAEFCCGYPVRGEVVRCRDCRWLMSYWMSDYCDYFKHAINSPDGFCKWGERK